MVVVFSVTLLTYGILSHCPTLLLGAGGASLESFPDMAWYLPRLVLTLFVRSLIACKWLTNRVIQQIAGLVANFSDKSLRLLLLRILDHGSAEQL